jgi:hypothetical protein
MGESRSASNKISILYAIAEAERQLALCAKVVVREEGHYYGIQSWGVNYERHFDRFASAWRKLETLRNPSQLPRNHPGRRDPSPLLPSRPPTGLRELLCRIFRLHDAIQEAVEVKSGVLDVNDRGVYASSPGPVRVLYEDTGILSILSEAESAATQLEVLLAQPAGEEQKEASSPSTILRLDRWDELGIGITEKTYIAFTPCPDTGAIVSLSQGVPLDLKGEKRWPVVLGCFARSEDGRTALRSELLTRLGYMPKGKIPDNHALREVMLRKFNRASRKLTSAMADLGKQLREMIPGPGKGPVFRGEAVESYTASFTTRFILKGEDGTFRFARG